MLKIGVGPSSSHTLGPWRICLKVLFKLNKLGILNKIGRIDIDLFSSLALTGKGHYTDKALIAGLTGLQPENVDLKNLKKILDTAQNECKIQLNGESPIAFDPTKNIHYLTNQELPYHPNAVRFRIATIDHKTYQYTFYSVGGGFIVEEGDTEIALTTDKALYEINSAEDLKKHCSEQKCSISELVIRNEEQLVDRRVIETKLLAIWEVMKESAYIGCHTEGILPGGLQVTRRAFNLNEQLLRNHKYTNADEWMECMKEGHDFRKVIKRVSCIAIAVNEVNADMGRIVTAPTNGSAGVIPAVLFYYICFSGQEVGDKDIVNFLVVAAEIGKLFKKGATISAAMGGCQAEIGVSSAMAAGALTECLGGSVEQALMASEIAMEHHLGLTCDPIGGLVQIPCIERNSMGAVKAITASMMALTQDPAKARVSLDAVIKTMNQTARDMNKNYKETSLGGLATSVSVNVPEC